ncbi:helix-turn-helix domain-containing protein [Paraburkholderia oxyphila]|uniref:helix-turn-helix domain-containing protein n=1 Tax=Paraburkholderia oxyphila TaxID=614212 RepID=UPI000488E428|nr:helix-turn-helix domain-containing protein [Paraburkholderia oxyphila]
MPHMASHETVRVSSMTALANLIRAARLEQGLTRDELANATGLSPKFITHVENGKPTAQFGKVLHLLAELGINLTAQSAVAISEDSVHKALNRRRSQHGR